MRGNIFPTKAVGMKLNMVHCVVSNDSYYISFKNDCCFAAIINSLRMKVFIKSSFEFYPVSLNQSELA